MARPAALVVGSGVAGATATSALNAAGAAVTVLEAKDHVGGRTGRPISLTIEHAGHSFEFPLDHGIHGVWRQYRNLRRLLAEHGLDRRLIEASEQELIAPDPSGGIIRAEVGRRLRETRLPDVIMPAALFSERQVRSSLLSSGPSGAAKVVRRLFHGASFDWESDLERYDHRTVQDLISDWPVLIRHLFSALSHSAFFRDPREVSLAAFFMGLQLYVLGDKRDTGFDYLPDDCEDGLIKPILEQTGATVRTGERVVRVHHDDRRLTKVETDKDSYEAEAFVFAVDPPGLQTLVREGGLDAAFDEPPSVPPGVRSTSVRLWYDRCRSSERPASGVFSELDADAFFWLEDILDPYRAFKAKTGASALELHLYGDRADQSAGESDDALLDKLDRLARRAWPGISSANLIRGHVTRNAPTHVAFTPGTLSRLPPVATRFSNVALAGDWVRAPAPVLYMERACMTGLLAAKEVADDLGVSFHHMPSPLAPHPPARSVAWARPIYRRLRRVGLFGPTP